MLSALERGCAPDPVERALQLVERGGGAEDHLVTVTGMTEGGDFILCDPAHPDQKPVVVTGEQLELFMSGKADAGAMWVAGSSTTTTGG